MKINIYMNESAIDVGALVVNAANKRPVPSKYILYSSFEFDDKDLTSVRKVLDSRLNKPSPHSAQVLTIRMFGFYVRTSKKPLQAWFHGDSDN